MGLRSQAAADARAILENESDFGCPITVIAPNHQTAQVVGFSADIGQLIDMETGLPVAGRQAHVALSMATLRAAGFTDLPVPINDEKKRPWVLRFADVNGVTRSYAVRDVRPDSTLGVVVCILEDFKG